MFAVIRIAAKVPIRVASSTSLRMIMFVSKYFIDVLFPVVI